MAKVRLTTQTYLYPMPLVLVGTIVDGTPDFLPVAWVTRTNAQPTSDFFFADIVCVWADEEILSDGRPDIELLRPFTLTMPDNRYWSVGGFVGKAWSIGKDFVGW